jgi:hypothetical protein
LHLGLDFSIGHLNMTVFDLVGLALAGTMIVVLLVGRAAHNLRELARSEPGASRRGKSERSRRPRLQSPVA